jgi:hypothetical protein
MSCRTFALPNILFGFISSTAGIAAEKQKIK